jgi:hypothetical protein
VPSNFRLFKSAGWSPDGRYIYFTSVFRNLYRINPDGTDRILLNGNHRFEFPPVPRARPAQAGTPTPTSTPSVTCRSDVVSVNIRETPSTSGKIVHSEFRKPIILGGIYTSGSEVWYRVVDIESITDPEKKVGWVSKVAYGGNNPCTEPPNINLPPVDALGNLLPTPTPSATPNFTATPVITPTLYPTVTPGVPVSPPTILCGEQAQWIQYLCLQGWNYLPNDKQNTLRDLILSGEITTDFLALQRWWLQYIGRGMMDVPPQIWQTDSLNQCGGNLKCQSIVHDVVYLFENMGRIGVDLPAIGSGQHPPVFLPAGNNGGSFTGNDNFACTNNRFLQSTLAAVCWVCQDLPTQLYLRVGYDLQTKMVNSTLFNGPFVDYASRNIDTVEKFINQIEGVSTKGLQTGPYIIGELVILAHSSNVAYHTGIVVHGSNSSNFEQVLDEVLIAQMSYSAEGFFTSNAGTIGKFEVITLRTYLYRLMSRDTQQNPYEPQAPYDLWNNRLRHVGPREITAR